MTDIYNILDSLSELVYVIDIETKEILYMNTACKKMIEEHPKALVTKEMLAEELGLSEDMLCSEGFFQWTYTSKLTGRIYKVRDKYIEWDGRKARFDLGMDITDDEHRKENLETRLEMEHFIVSCIIEMHRNNTIDVALNNLLEMMGKFLEADRVYIFNYNKVKISNTHEWCAPDVSSEIDTLQDIDSNFIDRWMEFFDRSESVIIEDIEDIRKTSPAEYETFKRQNIKSAVISPMEDEGKLIGFIGVDNPPEEKVRQCQLLFSALAYFISSMIVREEKDKCLLKLSYNDMLTGLFNRNKFIENSRRITAEKKACVGVVYMDLNGLKAINDSKGHDAGDEALKALADVVVSVFGSERSYRVGGDEFVALCDDMPKAEFKEKIEELSRAVSKLEHSPAIGYQYAADVQDVEDITKAADSKMYIDKKYYYRNQEVSRYRFCNDTFAAISTPDLLKQLIKEERFVIWFQPKFTVDTLEFCGSEALIRFFDEDDVLVSPMDFVPEMEDNNTIHLIDFYVFRHVCEYLSGWIEAGKNVKPVSINLSHRTMMKSGFIENFMNIWHDYKVPKELLIIEVSENQERGGVAQIEEVLVDLKKRGFKIAIDNFGSKYADIYLFADLKFDILKLDGDMVYKIETDKKANLLSTSIAQICHSESIKIVAEGVENEQELEVLREMGCDEAQGYYFDRPMSWNKFEEKYL